MHTLWNTIFYQPLYNALLFCVSVAPGANVGLALIFLTIVVKLILFPLTQKSINSQIKMKELEPELTKIKNTYPDKAEQSKKTFALYKENKINPFSSCLLVIVQLPILVALYMCFKYLGQTPAGVYSFIHIPANFNLNFYGLANLTQKSIYFAVLAGILQFIQGYLAQGRQSKPTGTDMKSEFAKSMQMQMLYFMPLMIVWIAYQYSAAVALYLITSNICTIGQELYTRRKIAKSANYAKAVKELKA